MSMEVSPLRLHIGKALWCVFSITVVLIDINIFITDINAVYTGIYIFVYTVL